MAEGRSNQAIGERLFLSPKTVEAHLHSIFTRLDLHAAPDDHRPRAGRARSPAGIAPVAQARLQRGEARDTRLHRKGEAIVVNDEVVVENTCFVPDGPHTPGRRWSAKR